jgi:hypothetical protein
LLIEQPGAWGREAVLESHLDEQTGRMLHAASRRHGFRVLLLRRPGWAEPDGRRRVSLVRTRPDGGWIEQLEVDDVRQLQDVPWEALDAVDPPGLGRPGPAVVHLVCTNGKHDPCCADKGRPVVRALAEAEVPEVWESSHVGGDRFAANVVCLPRGVYFGRVQPEEAAELVADYGRGQLWLDRYRGVSSLSALTQAAEHFARLELDERRLEGLRVVSSQAVPGAVTVHLDHGGRAVEVVVSRHREGPAPLSCGAQPSHPWVYRVDSFTVDGS